MAKHLTPIIGLAVVVALALAAVFGSMSLANPAMAAIGQPADAELTERVDSPQTAPMNLRVDYSAAVSQVTLKWDKQEGYVQADYQVRWKSADAGWLSDQWVGHTAGSVDITPATGDAEMAVITAASVVTPSGGNANPILRSGTTYDFEVRIRKNNMDYDASEIQAVPNDVATSGVITMVSVKVDADEPGEVVLTWSPENNPTNPDGDDATSDGRFTAWQYLATPGEVSQTAGADTADDASDDRFSFTADSDAMPMWTDLTGVTGGGTDGTGNYMATVDGLDSKDYRFQVRARNGMTVSAEPGMYPGGTGAVESDGTEDGTATDETVAVAIMPPAVPFSTSGKAELVEMPDTGVGQVTLEWEEVEGSTHFSVQATREDDAGTRYTDVQHSQMDINDARERVVNDVTSRRYTVEDLMGGVVYTFVVRLYKGADATGSDVSTSDPVTATPEVAVIEQIDTKFSAASDDPGDNSRYTFAFNAKMTYTPGINDLVVEFNEDFSVPSTIAESSVNIQVGTGGNVTHPVSVLVDGEEITLELGDLTDEDDNDLGTIPMGTPVTVVFRPSAGISNPTEGGMYDEIKAQEIDIAADEREAGGDDNRFQVIIKISLDEDEGGRGDVITVSGKGFKNGTTVTFMRMASEKDRMFADAEPLCAAQADGDDIAKCQFTVTSPLFQPGDNYINGVDGRSNPGTESKAFALDPSISANPASGAPGDSLQIQLNDFNQGSITGVLIARRYICEMSGEANMLAKPCPTGYNKWTPNEAIPMNGEVTFRMVIPNDAPRGVQDLRVESTGGNDGTNITIAGPRVTSNPLTVIGNQRLSLTGNGFTSNSRISRITFAGDEIEMWPTNTGPSVDNGGNWSLSVDLPITASTTSAGDHRILVEDQDGRTGSVMVTVPERSVSITPDTGRVGTVAVVRGENFPSKNDEGSTFSLSIIYEAQNGRTTTSAIPDASGKFETQIRIPTTATIPSTNLITVSLDGAMGTMAPGSGQSQCS